MIINALVDHYEHLADEGILAKPGWCTEKVSYALDISLQGELLGVIPLKVEEVRGKKTVEIPRKATVPERVIKSVNISANFLCENSSYMLGVDKKGKPERSMECFEACRDLHLSVLENIDTESANAIKYYFTSWEPKQAEINELLQPYLDDIMSGRNLVFMINGGAFAHEIDEIKNAWDDRQNNISSVPGQYCMVTGKQTKIARLHGKIKGVPNAQSAGANLISFNAPSFHSYGKDDDEDYDVPVGEYAAFAYSTSLNHLLSDEKHRQMIGDTMTVYWSADGKEEAADLFGCALDPFDVSGDADAVIHDAFSKLAKGQPIGNVDLDTPFYVLGIAPNAARLSVRFFLQDTFGSMLQNLYEHYNRLEIERPSFDTKVYLSIPMLLRETINPNSRDKASSPLLSGEVLRAVLTGGRYPIGLYQSVLNRVRAEQDNPEKKIKKITRGRAAIIKACLSQMLKDEAKEVLSVSLNEETNKKAYVLGRLFAVLEKIQSHANPGINSTIKDRYFTSANATPKYVFVRLLNLSNHHLKKLDTPFQIGYEKEIRKLMEKLNANDDPFPAHLSLEDQGLFILGYYHETQKRFRASANKEEKTKEEKVLDDKEEN